MKKKLIAVLTAATVAALCVPVLSACNASTGYTLKTDEDGNKYYVASCSGISTALNGELVIEDYYGEGENRYPVAEIAEKGFSGTNITKVTIPATVKKIGTAAFAYSNLLRTVEFENGGELDEISQGAFGYCESLTEINLPASVKTIGYMSFYSCKSLKDVGMPAVEGISAKAFENCYSLEEITLPETLVTIGARAFCYSALTEIVIPDSVKATVIGEDNIPAIGDAAFHSCTALKRAVVGKGVAQINPGVFGYCTALTDLWLPETLTKIEGARYNDNGFYCGHAFHNNNALENVYYAGTQEMWNSFKDNIDNKPVTEGGATFDNSALFKAKLHVESPYSK